MDYAPYILLGFLGGIVSTLVALWIYWSFQKSTDDSGGGMGGYA